MKRKSTLELLKDKSGAALITVLVIFLTLVVIVTSATMMAHANFMRAQKTANFSSAYYVAETGLNEMIDTFKTYHEEISSDMSGTEIQHELRALLGFNGAEFATKEYGKVMNENAYANIYLEYMGDDEETKVFILTSDGYLGNNSRTVSTTIRLRSGSNGTLFQPDAVVNLDKSFSNIPIQFGHGGDVHTLRGPFITNRPIHFTSGNPNVVYGPILSNSTIEFSKVINTSNKPVFITSGNITFRNNQDHTFHAIMLKDDAILTSEVSSNNISISYLFVPTNRMNEKILFGTDDKFNISNIIYYNPVNFDPYNATITSATTGHKLNNEMIFGLSKEQGGQYNYKEYFHEDFILDNISEASIDEYYPSYSLPIAPSSTKTDDVLLLSGVVDFTNENGTYFYDEIRTSNNWNPITVNVGNKKVVLVTERLQFLNTILTVNIEYEGSLEIYVVPKNGNVIDYKDVKLEFIESNINYETKSGNNEIKNPSNRFRIIVPKMNGTQAQRTMIVMNAFIKPHKFTVLTENMNLENLGVFAGNFISLNGEQAIFKNAGGNSDTQLVYFPNGTIIVEGGTNKGVFISNSFRATGWATYEFNTEYDKSNSDEIFGEILEPGSGGNDTDGIQGEFYISPIREVD